MKTKTEEILELSCPYDNPYQGADPRVLFVCSVGLLRSPTAARVFARKGWNTRSCGSDAQALIPISANLIAWAHKIYFVNQENYNQAIHTFSGSDTPGILKLLKEKSQVLDIEDSFNYNNPKLIKQLKEKMGNVSIL